MSIASFWKDNAAAKAPRHPNELDLRRIARAIQARERYRYVKPSVVAADGGYLVRSPCCSRNIDADGGEIDIALLRWSDSPSEWLLYRRDHAARNWIIDSRFTRLPALFERLNNDPDRIFWQ